MYSGWYSEGCLQGFQTSKSTSTLVLGLFACLKHGTDTEELLYLQKLWIGGLTWGSFLQYQFRQQALAGELAGVKKASW